MFNFSSEEDLNSAKIKFFEINTLNSKLIEENEKIRAENEKLKLELLQRTSISDSTNVNNTKSMCIKDFFLISLFISIK